MPACVGSVDGKLVQELVEFPYNGWLSGCRIEGIISHCDQRLRLKTCGEAFEPHRRNPPVSIAARAREEIDLPRDTFTKQFAQFGVQRSIIARRSRQSRIKSTRFNCHVGHSRRGKVKLGFILGAFVILSGMAGGSRIIAFGNSGDIPAEPEGQHAEDIERDEKHYESSAKAPDSDVMHEEMADDLAAFDDAYRPVSSWLPAVLALVTITGWTTLFAVSRFADLSATTSLAGWTAILTDWSVPVLLISIAWLIFMRNGTREATKFGHAARLLSAESERLETRLLTLNQELSLAREFLASETRDLEALGRVATERLSQNAHTLENLIRENSERIETIGTVSGTALENMEKLRGQLPVIASSAKDVTNNIGNAGRTAHAQIEDMANGFKKINEFGQASDRQVAAVRELAAQTIADFTEHFGQLEEIANGRFAELHQQSQEFRARLEKQEIDAIATLRDRAAAFASEFDRVSSELNEREQATLNALHERIRSLGDEGGAISSKLLDSETEAQDSWRHRLREIEEERSSLFTRIADADTDAVEAARARVASIDEEARLIEEGVAQRRSKLTVELDAYRKDAELAEKAAIERLGAMLAPIDDELAKRAEIHEERGARIVEQAEAAAIRLLECIERMTGINARASETEQQLAASLDGIGERVLQARAALAETDTEIAEMTESSVRLLELTQASSQQIRVELPNALHQSEDQLAAFEASMRKMRETVEAAGSNGRFLANQIESSGIKLKTMIEDISSAQTVLRDHSSSYKDSLSSHARSLSQLHEQAENLATKVSDELTNAIAKLDVSARDAVSAIGEHGAANISTLAEQLGEASGEAIDKAMRAKATEAAGQLEHAAAHAAGVSREAAIQLRDQLAKVDELVGNLEQRVVHARVRAQEQVDNDFARRAALITESLNSNAIDIAKALSTEVSDTAWEGYLKGDRGIFTRRAVNLIDSGDSKAIQQVFDRDNDFREHVSRYIHDFEAILRQVLSARDGNALGVTLLSSDMGKLYVALAQSIERLRT